MKTIYKRILLIFVYILLTPFLILAGIKWVLTGNFYTKCPDILIPLFTKIDKWISDILN